MMTKASIKCWWRVSRPHSLGTAMGPVFIAAACAFAGSELRLWLLPMALFGVLLLLIGTNLANDYFDFRHGADALLARGSVENSASQAVLYGAIAALALALAMAILLVFESGIGLLFIGVGAVFFAVQYTAPPLRLAYRGLGEATAFLLMGPALAFGAFDALSGTVSWLPVVASVPSGLLIAAILHANNIRDRDADACAGKRTLAVRLGVHGARRELQALFILPFVVTTAFAALGWLPPWALLVLVALVPAVRAARATRMDAMGGGAAMRTGANLQLAVSALMTLGLLLSRL